MMAETAKLLSSSDSGKVITFSSTKQTGASQLTSEVADDPSCIEEGERNHQAILPLLATTSEKRSSISAMDNEDIVRSK